MTCSTRLATLLATTAFIAATGAAGAATHGSRPMFAVIPRVHSNVKTSRPPALPTTWNFTFTYQGTQYTDAFIGGNPNAATSLTVPIYLVPIELEYGSTTENASGITSSVVASPIFTSIPFTFGGVNIGTTQYEDAFAKVNVWDIGGSASGYHVLLGTPSVKSTQVLKIPTRQGKLGTEFGVSVILVQINWFDTQVNSLITKLGIPQDSLPIFVTTQSYLISGSECCIGGYHSVTSGGQPYSVFTYIQKTGAFSQDVSALSHELGEWIDDPYTNNNSPCGILEVGDPLEGDANYGDYAYTAANGATFHLQDLALLPYFGVPKGTTLNQLFTLQGTSLTVCENGS